MMSERVLVGRLQKCNVVINKTLKEMEDGSLKPLLFFWRGSLGKGEVCQELGINWVHHVLLKRVWWETLQSA